MNKRTILSLHLLFICFLLIFPCNLYAFGEVSVSFTGLDRLHISYSVQPTNWGVLYPEMDRTTTDIVLVQYREGAETTIASGSNGIQGAHQVTGMGTDAFRYVVTEYYRTQEAGGGETEGSTVRGETEVLYATREISGTLLFNESIDGGGASDTTLRDITILSGNTLTLSNMNPNSANALIQADGDVTIDGCTNLSVLIYVAEGSKVIIRNNSTFKGFSLSGPGQASIGNSTFLKGYTPSFGLDNIGLTPIDNLSIQDSTFLDGANFVIGNLGIINGCDFLRGTVKIVPTTASLSIINNVFADLLILEPFGTTPPPPSITGNSFLGEQTITSSQTFPLAGNYWGGAHGPRHMS